MAERLARSFLCILGLALLPAPRALACDLPAGETATVESVIDGETLLLSDGRKVRLAGVKAPSAPLGWRGEDPWPFVAEAKEEVARLLPKGATVELRVDERLGNRHGHALAQVFMVVEGKPLWLQETPVGRGFARVYSLPDARACVPALLDVEAAARKARAGLWRSWAYRVRDAADIEGLRRLTRTYQLVEGTVHAVGEGRKLLYVNFAEDWRRDFTVTIERGQLARFESAGIDLSRLAGARVRVRGWLEWWNGPMIAATHPEQIEVLGPAPPAL